MEQSKVQFEKMTKTPIPKLISTLAIPTIISMLVTSVYNLADTYFVSQLNNNGATGAVNVVFSLMALIQAFSFTIGMGAGTWISRLLGRSENERANSIGSSALLMALVLGGLIALFGKLFIGELMTFLGADAEIMPYAKAYGDYILYAAPVMAASFVLNNLLRSEGKARFSMIGIGIGGILNIALDPVFIFDWGLNLGTAGAAMATGISQCVGFLILLTPYLLKKTNVRLSVRRLSKRGTDYLRIVRNGLPSFVRQSFSSIAGILLNHMAAMFHGDYSIAAVIAAMGIVTKIFMVVFSVIIGFGQGFQPVIGYNYGAKLFRRVKQSFVFTLLTMTVLILVFSIVGFFAAPNLIALFGKDGADESVAEIAVFAFRAQCVAMPLMPLGTVCNMTYQSIGKSWTATLLSGCRQGFFYVPAILILSFAFGLTGLQIAQAVADVLTCLVCIPVAFLFFKEINGMEKSEVFEKR
ncbi:MAG: MATE family efflux transporter [Clostridia bacterium]|nr:MATE family efflux transporter [Clostridia bacterium]